MRLRGSLGESLNRKKLAPWAGWPTGWPASQQLGRRQRASGLAGSGARAGWLADLACWLACWLATRPGQPAGRLAGWLTCWPASWLGNCLTQHLLHRIHRVSGALIWMRGHAQGLGLALGASPGSSVGPRLDRFINLPQTQENKRQISR